MSVMTIGMDTSKSWFQVHGVNESGQIVLRRKLARGRVLQFFAGLTPCVVGLEACGGGTSGRASWRSWGMTPG